MGAILRSAFFFGADGIAITGHSAPLSAVALKAAAGAAELLPLMTIRDPFTFLDKSKAHGWHVYAADSSVGVKSGGPKSVMSSQLVSPLQRHPCILMMGSEGKGIRDRILQRADTRLRIVGQRVGQGGVDSLNVSVAAGVLIEAFLRRPSTLNQKQTKGPESEGKIF